MSTVHFGTLGNQISCRETALITLHLFSTLPLARLHMDDARRRRDRKTYEKMMEQLRKRLGAAYEEAEKRKTRFHTQVLLHGVVL